MKISFLASHGGSAARAIIAEIQSGRLTADIGIVISNNRDSAIIQWCLENDIPHRHVSAKTHRGAENADEAIMTLLQNAETNLVVCSGYMKKIGPRTLAAFPSAILNIHPALLPKFGGQGMYGDKVHNAVLAAGEKFSGATVHYVTEGIDEGPVLLQAKIAVEADDTLESLRAKVQAEEPGLYIKVLQKLLTEQ